MEACKGKPNLKEKESEEGIKQVEIEMKVEGITPGKKVYCLVIEFHPLLLKKPCTALADRFKCESSDRTDTYTLIRVNRIFHAGDDHQNLIM